MRRVLIANSGNSRLNRFIKTLSIKWPRKAPKTTVICYTGIVVNWFFNQLVVDLQYWNNMTGKGHRLTGLGAGFFAAALTHTLGYNYTIEMVSALLAAFSTTIPDWIEIPTYKRGVRTGTLIPHRTITHWPPLWLGLIYVAFHYLDPLYAAAVIGICVGALAHILADAPNPMGIPWILPFSRLSIAGGLWRSGQFENTIVFVFTAAGIATWVYTHQDTPLVQAIINGVRLLINK